MIALEITLVALCWLGAGVLVTRICRRTEKGSGQ